MDKHTHWPDNAQLALSIVVNIEEGSERCLLDGDQGPEIVDELGIIPNKPIRAHGNESNYYYGLTEGWPRIHNLLTRYSIPVTITAAALSLERAPTIAKTIKENRYEVAAHGYRWMHQYKMNEDQERSFILNARSSIEHTTGQRPVGWLSRYLHTDNTRRLLQEAGFLYHMDDYSADEPFWTTVDNGKSIVIVPYAIDSNDMKFWTSPSLTPEAWLNYAKHTLNVLLQEGRQQTRMMSLGLHLRIIGRPGRIWALEAFLDYARNKKNIWITTRRSIAECFAKQNPKQEPRPNLR